MEAKNYAEVLIDGKIYTLGGSEDERYLQRVASYINEKTAQLKKQPGFTKQSQDYQTVMVELNIADDYFKMLDESLAARQQKEDMEKMCIRDRYYTGQEWEDMANYDLPINTSRLELDEAVQLVKEYIKLRGFEL